MKKTININFSNIWEPKPTPNNFFKYMPVMYRHYNFSLSNTPDYVFCATYNNSVGYSNNPKKILIETENRRPKMGLYDWAFTSWYDRDIHHPRHMRLPLYKFFGAGKNLIKRKNVRYEQILKQKTRFCAFIYYSNVPLRNRFFKAVSKYKKVDAPGRVFKNMHSIAPKKNGNNVHSSRMSITWPEEKVHFLKRYKFTIAFENSKVPGYTSEKIIHPMLSNSLPIYWGNPHIERDFNTNSIIHIRSENDFDAAIDEIIQLDKDDDLYVKKMLEPWYPNNRLTKYVDNARIINRFRTIFGEK